MCINMVRKLLVPALSMSLLLICAASVLAMDPPLQDGIPQLPNDDDRKRPQKALAPSTNYESIEDNILSGPDNLFLSAMGGMDGDSLDRIFQVFLESATFGATDDLQKSSAAILKKHMNARVLSFAEYLCCLDFLNKFILLDSFNFSNVNVFFFDVIKLVREFSYGLKEARRLEKSDRSDMSQTSVVHHQISQDFMEKNLELLTALNKKFQEKLKTNFTDVFALDFFDDLTEDKITKFSALLKNTNANGIKEDDIIRNVFFKGLITAGYPIYLTEDDSDLAVVFPYDGDFSDKLPAFSASEVSNAYVPHISGVIGLNGAHAVLNRADKAYPLLMAKFKERIIKAIEQGKKVRLLGNGSTGSIAEAIVYKLKNDLKNIENNQIQVVTFGSLDFIHQSSAAIYNKQMGLNNIRFRFEKDETAKSGHYGAVPTGSIFIVKDQVNYIRSSLDFGHSPLHIQGSLSNTKTFNNFKRYVMAYRLLKIENEVVEYLNKIEAGQDQIVAMLERVCNLKSNIFAFYQKNEEGQTESKEKSAMLGQIKMACIGLLNDQNHETLPSINLIIEIINHKELLFKRKAASAMMTEGMEEKTLVHKFMALLAQGEAREKANAFRALIALTGQSNKTLNLHNEKFPGLKEALITYLMDQEQKLNPQLSALKAENPERMAKFLRRLAEGKVSAIVGEGFVGTGKGLTGTLFVLDLSGKRIGVFKGAGQNGLIKGMIGQASALSPEALAQPHSECAAYKVSLDLGLDFAPITIMTKFNVAGEEIEGAFMELFEGYREATLDDMGLPDLLQEAEIARFQEMAFLDYFLGNYDRHLDNLFLEENGNLCSLKCIDNANAFPVCGPNRVNGHNMYKWAEFPIAKAKFKAKALEFIKNLDEKKLNTETLAYIRKSYPSFLNEKNLGYLNKRLAVIKSILHEKSSIKCPEDLAKYRTRAEIDEYLGSLN